MDRKHPPLVSVITPTYNHAAWIAACIESVQAQTYPHWEQIIVDDGSTDGTGDAIRPYLDDPRIRYLRQENRGIWHLADNYNTGLRASNGDLIAVLEGDDVWLPDKLEIQVPAFDDETIGLAYGRIAIVDDRGDRLAEDTARMDAWEPPFASFAAETPYPFLRDLFLLQANVVPLTLVFRRAALEAIGGFCQPRYFPAIDFPTLLRVATHFRAAFHDRPLGAWRKHVGQTTDIHGLRYAHGHTQAAISYFHALPDSVRSALELTEREIWVARRPYLADAHRGAARASMRVGNWRQAQRYALGMLWWGKTLRRTEGLVDLLASTVHVDPNDAIDWLALRTPALSARGRARSAVARSPR